MSKDALYGLIDKVDESDLEMVYFILSRIVKKNNEATPFPDEIEAIEEYERDKENGSLVLSTAEEAWGSAG